MLVRIAMSEIKWITIDELCEITGFTKRTVEKWRDKGWIRMFKPGDSREWRTTLRMWEEDERILIEAGLLDTEGKKRTLSERKRRISTLKRNRLGLE